MSFVKETGSCAPDKLRDEVKIQPVTANPETIEARTVRVFKFPPCSVGLLQLLALMEGVNELAATSRKMSRSLKPRSASAITRSLKKCWSGRRAEPAQAR